jgi:hypothetical protein
MALRTVTPEELKTILDLHRRWRNGEEGGIRANLADANLARADLARAYLADANLADANLADANLADANLAGANLAGADLAGANLAGADLAGAYLARANLARAYLARANLAGAYLADANLARANLARANLAGADLARANLADANLARANLAVICDDVRAVLATAPAEVPGLLAALREGRVDGRVYEGDCACLVGTIANIRGCHYTAVPGLKPNDQRAAEKWFMAIGKGSTPATNPVSAITEKWIVEWLAEQPPAPPASAAEVTS